MKNTHETEEKGLNSQHQIRRKKKDEELEKTMTF